MTPAAFAEKLNICLTTVYLLIRRNKLPHVRIGSAIRIPAVALDEFTQQAMAVVGTDSAAADEFSALSAKP